MLFKSLFYIYERKRIEIDIKNSIMKSYKNPMMASTTYLSNEMSQIWEPLTPDTHLKQSMKALDCYSYWPYIFPYEIVLER